jgi:pimeloyl-ACP methyl ester carboxylesterase
VSRAGDEVQPGILELRQERLRERRRNEHVAVTPQEQRRRAHEPEVGPKLLVGDQLPCRREQPQRSAPQRIPREQRHERGPHHDDRLRERQREREQRRAQADPGGRDQHQTVDPCGCAGGDACRDETTEGVAHEMRALEAELVKRTQNRSRRCCKGVVAGKIDGMDGHVRGEQRKDPAPPASRAGEAVKENDSFVGGTRLHWRECGSGDPIVLVHGFGVAGRYLLPTARRLAETHHALVPDLPGFGRSAKPPRRLGIRGLTDALAAWLDGLELRRVPLVANSFGCQLVVELALRRPDLVGQLVLIGPTIDRGGRSFARQLARLVADTALEPPPLWPIIAVDYAVFIARGGLRLIPEMLDDRLEEKLPHVDADTIVVRGARDVIVSLRWAEDVAAALPHAALAVIPHSSHAANYSAPDEVADLVRRFLARSY